MAQSRTKKPRQILSPGELEEIQEKIGVKFLNPRFLEIAFVHRSYLNEIDDPGIESNERMEFLGDRVLSLVVAEHLYRAYPKEPEGKLTAFQAALVNGKALGDLAEALGFATFVRMSRGERSGFEAKRRGYQYLLCCVLEAVIGAVYLDRGVGTVELMLSDLIFPKLQGIIRTESYRDPKSVFQERCQAEGCGTPRYEVLEESGPDHDKRFRVAVFAGDQCHAEGFGHSKLEAEVAAATAALSKNGSSAAASLKIR